MRTTFLLIVTLVMACGCSSEASSNKPIPTWQLHEQCVDRAERGLDALKREVLYDTRSKSWTLTKDAIPRIDDIIGRLQQCAEKYPNSDVIWDRLGERWADRGSWGKADSWPHAVEAYERSTELSPEDEKAYAYLRLGNARAMTCDLEGAAEAWRIVTEQGTASYEAQAMQRNLRRIEEATGGETVKLTGIDRTCRKNGPATRDPWPPRGFFPLSQDVAFRWTDTPCGDDETCWTGVAVSQTGCPDDLYLEASITDENDTVVDWSNHTTGSLKPLQRAKVRFVSIAESTGDLTAEISKTSCR